MYQTFREIIALWRTPDVLADEIGVKRETVRKWRFRNAIPPAKWLAVIGAANAKGIPLTTMDFAVIAARKEWPRVTRTQQERIAAE